MNLQPPPCLTELTASADRVCLHGIDMAMELESPAEGVVRLRCAPRSRAAHLGHPRLPVKESFARPAGSTSALEGLRARRDGDTVHVEGQGASIAISMSTGQWSFAAGGPALARSLGYAGEHTPAYPEDRVRSRLTLLAPPGEAYLGFGEKVGALDKRGRRFTFWNTDCFPPQPHTDPLYVSIPFFLAVRAGTAWGLFLDEPARSHVDVASSHPEQLQWEVEGPELDVYLIVGPRPADVLRRYVELTGKPFAPPLFSLGAQQSRWGYPSAVAVRELVAAYRAHRLPLDVVYLDIDHLDAYKALTWDPDRFPEVGSFVEALRADGVHLVTIVDPALKMEPGWSTYEEARARDYLVRFERGAVLVGEVWPDPAVFPDFSRAEVRSWWGGLQAGHVRAGVAGMWIDMNEPSCFSVAEARGIPTPEGRAAGHSAPVGSTLPDEARHGTRRHLEVHNVYGLGMARATYEGLRRLAPERRPFVLSRAGYAGIQQVAALWTGDFGSHWSHLEASLPMLLGLGLSGVPFVGADVGGFVGDTSGELLVRWTQCGVFVPLLRNHAAKGTRGQEPWRFGEPWLTLTREALALRYRLLPTLYSAMIEAHASGEPPIVPLVFEHPGDPHALAAHDQLLFARSLLVAPVVHEGHTRRMVYLPAGTWMPLGMDLACSHAAPCGGGRHLVAEAALDTIPMYLAAGRGFASTEAELHTTTAEWAHLDWHLFVSAEEGATASAVLYEDAGDGEVAGTWTRITATRVGKLVKLERNTTGPGHDARRVERVILHGTCTVAVVPGWTSLDVEA